MFRKSIPKTIVLTLTLFAFACTRVPTTIEPVICAPPHPKEIQREHRTALYLPEGFSVSPFPCLTAEEAQTDWGKEYRIALCFATDFDLYRAITGFKRALCLLSPDDVCRRLELEYQVALAYFLGKKYIEAAYSIESTGLIAVDPSFAAYSDLLLILYESYQQLGKIDHACHILNLINADDPIRGDKLALLSTVQRADLAALCEEAECDPERAYLARVVSGYQKGTKSVRKAQWLNAVLPGAGYWYVGQRETAVTALVINALFIAAAVQFFCHGNEAAGAVTLSFESGWYFGGITGAGLAAKYYNEQLYCSFAGKITQREGYFPVMMLKYSF